MTATKLQATQTVLDDVLSEIGNTSRERLDLILGKINTALKIPGLLSCTGSDKVVSVGSTTLTLPNGKKETLTLGDTDIGGLSGSVDFATGTGSGDVQTVTLPVMTPTYWVKAGFEIRSDKKIYVVFGTQGASESTATFPDWSPVSHPLGYVSLQDNGSGAFLNVTNAYIYQIKPAPAILLDHTILDNRDAADQHPSSSISPSVTNFTDFLRSTDDTDQKIFDKIDDYTSIRIYSPSLTYLENNVVKHAGSVWKCTTDGATGVFDEAKWELLQEAPTEELQTVSSPTQTVFTLASVTIPTAATKLLVFVNGVYQIKDTHYTVDSSTQVTFVSAIPQNAQVLFKVL